MTVGWMTTMVPLMVVVHTAVGSVLRNVCVEVIIAGVVAPGGGASPAVVPWEKTGGVPAVGVGMSVISAWVPGERVGSG